MENWKNVPLSEEEEGIMVEGEAELGDKNFHRMLVGKLWNNNPFNVKVFKSTMIQAWRLRNNVDIQDLGKNLFLFRFFSKRDAEAVLAGGTLVFR